jgi:hypothetical protein
MVHVSIWDSDEHAGQMGRLKGNDRGRPQRRREGRVSFIPIVNYPVDWVI